METASNLRIGTGGIYENKERVGSSSRRTSYGLLSSDSAVLLGWNPISDYGRLWEYLLNYHHGSKAMKEHISKLYQLLKDTEILVNDPNQKDKLDCKKSNLQECERIVRKLSETLNAVEKECYVREWNKVQSVNRKFSFQGVQNAFSYMEARLSDSLMVFAMILSCIVREIPFDTATVNYLRCLGAVVVWVHDTFALYRTSDINTGKSIYDHYPEAGNFIDHRVVLLFAQVMCDEMRFSGIERGICSIFTDFVRAHIVVAMTHPWYGIWYQISEILASRFKISRSSRIPSDPSATCSLLISHVKALSYGLESTVLEGLLDVLTRSERTVFSLIANMTPSFRTNAELYAATIYPTLVSKVASRNNFAMESVKFGIYCTTGMLNGSMTLTAVEHVSVIHAVVFEAKFLKNVDSVGIVNENLYKVAAEALNGFCDEMGVERSVRPDAHNLLRKTIAMQSSNELKEMRARTRLNPKSDTPILDSSVENYLMVRMLEGIWMLSEWICHYSETTKIPTCWLYQTNFKLYMIGASEMLGMVTGREESPADILKYTDGEFGQAVKSIYCTACTGYVEALHGYTDEVDSFGQRIGISAWSGMQTCVQGTVLWNLLDKLRFTA